MSQCYITLAVVMVASALQGPPAHDLKEILTTVEAEISLMSSHGYYLSDSKVITFMGKPSATVVIFNPWNRNPKHPAVLEICENRGKALIVKKKVEDFAFNLECHTGNDINGDGYPEIVVERLTGGNCLECRCLSVYQVRASMVKELVSCLPAARLINCTDSRMCDLVWQANAIPVGTISDLGQAYNPVDVRVFGWVGNKYSDRSMERTAYFDQLIDEYKTEITERAKDDYSRRLAIAVNIYLRYYRSGRCDYGEREYRHLVMEIVSRGNDAVKSSASNVWKYIEGRYPCRERTNSK